MRKVGLGFRLLVDCLLPFGILRPDSVDQLPPDWFHPAKVLGVRFTSELTSLLQHLLPGALNLSLALALKVGLFLSAILFDAGQRGLGINRFGWARFSFREGCLMFAEQIRELLLHPLKHLYTLTWSAAQLGYRLLDAGEVFRLHDREARVWFDFQGLTDDTPDSSKASVSAAFGWFRFRRVLERFFCLNLVNVVSRSVGILPEPHGFNVGFAVNLDGSDDVDVLELGSALVFST